MEINHRKVSKDLSCRLFVHVVTQAQLSFLQLLSQLLVVGQVILAMNLRVFCTIRGSKHGKCHGGPRGFGETYGILWAG